MYPSCTSPSSYPGLLLIRSPGKLQIKVRYDWPIWNKGILRNAEIEEITMGNLTQYGCRFMSENNTEQTSKYEKSCYSLKFNAIGVLSCFGKVLTDNIYKQNCHERRASTQRIVYSFWNWSSWYICILYILYKFIFVLAREVDCENVSEKDTSVLFHTASWR